MPKRPVVIDLTGQMVDVEYTAGDYLVISVTVLDTDDTPIVWGSSTAVGQIRRNAYDTGTPVETFAVDISTNGKLVATLTEAETWTLWNAGPEFAFSIQVTRSGRASTYLAGTLKPKVHATHP